jgi:glycine hydroxymethyltransferase
MDQAEETRSSPSESLARAAVRQIYRWIEASERWVDQDGLNLYAGTNIQSPAVRRALTTTLNSRPSLGDPGDKYETGLRYSDEIERVAARTLQDLFGARFVEYRVLSGSMANLYAYLATTEPGDAVLAEPPEGAGHATHQAYGAAGLYRLAVHPIPHEPGSHRIDWEAFGRAVDRVRPKLIIVGTSLPLLPYDIPAVRALADRVGARVLYDAAHVSGLLAAGLFQRPLAEGADLVTLSTYKSFGGPAGGLVLTNDEALARRLAAIAYPGLTANFDMARVAGLAVAALEMACFGPDYGRQCLANAARLAEELAARGLAVWRPASGEPWTKTHLVALEAAAWGSGTAAARRAEASNVFFSGIPLPTPWTLPDYAGVRPGVQELTRWGMTEGDMARVAEFLRLALQHPECAAETSQAVKRFRQDFQRVHYGFSADV